MATSGDRNCSSYPQEDWQYEVAGSFSVVTSFCYCVMLLFVCVAAWKYLVGYK